MAKKHYIFHYAEMNHGELVNLGTLHYSSENSADRQVLIQAARQHLNRPEAEIIISHVSKLSRAEFDLDRNTSLR